MIQRIGEYHRRLHSPDGVAVVRRRRHCNPAIPCGRRRRRARIFRRLGNRAKQTIELSRRRILGDKLAVSVR